MRPRQFRRRHFQTHFLAENCCILKKISFKFVPQESINNIPALVQIMAWRRPSDKPLSEPMMVILLTHICTTQPQWVKISVAYGDVIWVQLRLKPPTTRLLIQQLVRANIKEAWALPSWPFARESFGEQWLPLTKDQYCGKRPNVMTSSSIMKIFITFEEWLISAYNYHYILPYVECRPRPTFKHMVYKIVNGINAVSC